MSQDSSNSISTAGGIKLGNYDLNIGTDGAYCASTNLFGATSMIGVTSDLYLKYEYSYTFGWDPIYTTTIYASGSFSLPVMGAVAMISYFGPYALWTFVPATQALK